MKKFGFGANYIKNVLTSVFLTSVLAGSSVADGDLEKLPFCGPDTPQGPKPSENLVFVSTLDGKVTALDSSNGAEKWSLQAGEELLSSSIHRLELTSGGQWVRLVPSLSGSLYQFSEDALEPLPLSADQLLSSSHKYSEDLVIAGGKETSSFGVSTSDGRIAYSCGLGGCSNGTAGATDLRDPPKPDPRELLVIRRVTQTVRAVEPRQGIERWNFSVGTHQLSLKSFEGCILPVAPVQSSTPELVYKVVVPEGLVCAVHKNAPHKVLWRHKLETPVVGAWHIEGSSLKEIDLFGSAQLPPGVHPDLPSVSPSVYIGMHDRQLYVQESVRMQALVQSQSSNRPAIGSGSHPGSLLSLPWRPVPARLNPNWLSPSDTALMEKEAEYATTAISLLYASDYVNGNGYYLYTPEDQRVVDDPTCDTNTSLAEIEANNDDKPRETHPEDSDDWTTDGADWKDRIHINVFVVSFWFWWKEVVLIAISSALFLNFITQRFRNKLMQRNVIIKEYRIEIPSTSLTPLPSSEPTPPPFVSRYETDFESISCLGRGGFGIVFEAKNKIDDCNYAVKRITLPHTSEKRNKVLREVRALAKLEHPHIVRYFNAWLEEPPIEWVNAFETQLKLSNDFTTDTYSKHPLVTSTKESVPVKKEFNKFSNGILNIHPDFSANNLSRIKSHLDRLDSVRQRSFSMNESVSIPVEKDESENDFSDLSCDVIHKIDELKDEDEENDDSFIVFDENYTKNSTRHPKTSGDSIISISDSDLQIHTNKSKKATVSVNLEACKDCGTKEYSKLKKGHRRNKSLDLKASRDKLMQPRGKVYLYIQMQLCRQDSLRDWLLKNQCPEIRKKEVVSIFGQIVDAVEYIHNKNLIHRDLKPGNIFFSPEGQIKVGDFGLVTTMADPLALVAAEQECEGEGSTEQTSDRHTLHVGTHLYMSPEQVLGERHNYKVDIWSLGLILVELLVPFSTEAERITCLKNLKKHRFPDKFEETFPQEHSLLRLMLSLKPECRPSTLGVRARAPLLHTTDPRYHFTMPCLKTATT